MSTSVQICANFHKYWNNVIFKWWFKYPNNRSVSLRFFCNPTPELPCPTIFTLLNFLRYIFGGPYKTLDDIYERSFARFFFVLDLQKNFRCIAIDCKYFSSFFSDISTIIGREKSRKLFLKEKKTKKTLAVHFCKKSDTILLHQHAK